MHHVAVASAALAEPYVLLVSALESILNVEILIDSFQHVWSVSCHGADSVVAAPLAAFLLVLGHLSHSLMHCGEKHKVLAA